MKYTSTSLGVTLSLLLLFACGKSNTGSETTADSTTVQDTLAEESDLENATSDVVIDDETNRAISTYYDPIDTDLELSLSTFGPLDNVLKAAERAIRYKDSIEYKRGNTELTDPGDSALFMPTMNKAHETILAYVEAMKGSVKADDQCPRITDLVRGPGLAGIVEGIITDTEKSDLLSKNDFSFLGGAPFVYKWDAVFKSPEGKAESRYTINVPKNSQFLFKAMRCHDSSPAEISFGPGINTYDGGEAEVFGMGSIIHTFSKRFPVIFITEEGPIDAQVVSAGVAFDSQYGCVSNNPSFTFASSSEVNEQNILGVYIPFTPLSLDNLKVTYLNGGGTWIADLDGDGVQDLACVAATFSGASGDDMSACAWFANIDGEWKLIDHGTQPDCT